MFLKIKCNAKINLLHLIYIRGFIIFSSDSRDGTAVDEYLLPFSDIMMDF